MSGIDGLNPPLPYPIVWLLIGLGLLVLVGIWIAGIFWLTREKKLKTVSSLQAKPAAQVDMYALRAKYLKLIDDAVLAYNSGTISARILHNQLSLLVRGFVYEACGFPAPRLTLSDLKKSRQRELTQLIEQLYPVEFAMITTANAQVATEAARKLVNTWA